MLVLVGIGCIVLAIGFYKRLDGIAQRTSDEVAFAAVMSVVFLSIGGMLAIAYYFISQIEAKAFEDSVQECLKAFEYTRQQCEYLSKLH